MTDDIGPMRCLCYRNKYPELKQHMKTYNCNGCRMDGRGEGYMCDECDYTLHSQCMYPSNKITPSFSRGDDIFEFMKEPLSTSGQGIRYCDACGMRIKGFVYHCYKTGFDLHPCCASLGTHLEIDGQRLTLKKESSQNKCDLCNLDGVNKSGRIDFGWFYASKNKDYKYHVSCIMILAIKHSISGGSALAKVESLPIVEKKRRGKDGSKYWKVLKAIVTYVIAIVFGDPTAIVAKLIVESVVQLGELL
ncbi:protein VACUOLELESS GAMETOPHYTES-like [Spinacia oleracea]|uniref:Protein VACUOLELESS GAMETOPHYTES-like n=1 Tax=Spinacia oleracea TaxID=3562 RepID=A0A9R0HRK2_SPIOL|nr:protein VACUOLELESS GAMETOPHYTES-like [Spinacia oleracea]